RAGAGHVVQAMEVGRGRPKRKAKVPQRLGGGLSDREVESRIEKLEKADARDFEEKEKKRVKAYEELIATRKKRRLDEAGNSQTIHYVTGQGRQQEVRKVEAFPVSKTRVRDAYEDSQLKRLEQQFYFTPTHEGDQFYSFQQGHDFVFYALTPEKIEVEKELPRRGKKPQKVTKKKLAFRRGGNAGPDYAGAALTADEAAQWVLDEIEGYNTLRAARARVGADINRLAGRLQTRIEYPSRFLWGNAGLATLSFIIRADKARVPEATPYIEGVLKDGKTSFAARFAGPDPIYLGTGDGPGRGPTGLRAQASKRNYDSDYSSDEETSSSGSDRESSSGED
nr:hypothetical protein [Thermoanaerobaculia bacterium]